MLLIEKITTRAGFDRLEPVWNSLLAESAGDRVTLTWEWLSAWWDVFGAERELCLLLVRDGEELIGIAPLQKRVVRHYGLLPYRRLEFLASGEAAEDGICSDYLDFIIRRGREAEALTGIFAYLRARQDEWDEMLLVEIPAASPNLPHLRRLGQLESAGWETLSREASYYLPLPRAWASLQASLRPKFQKNLRRDRRRAERSGRELLIIDSLPDFAANFALLVRLHQACWMARGERGAFASQRFSRFHRLLAPQLLRKGWLKLFVLKLQAEPVAALYAFTYKGKMDYYQSGYAQPAGPLASPGTLIQSYAIEAAIESGCYEFDFLKGDQQGYKVKWGAQTRDVVNLRLAQTQSKETVYRTAARLAGSLRQIKRALRRAAAACLSL